jgi:transcription antitermination factor NusA-like protein
MDPLEVVMSRNEPSSSPSLQGLSLPTKESHILLIKSFIADEHGRTKIATETARQDSRAGASLGS